MRRCRSRSSVLWWVTKGRAWAPPASRWRIGVSTSMKPWLASVLRNEPDHGVADLEDPAGLLVDDEVGVALAVAGVGVGEALPLVGQRPHGLGQQLEALDLDRQLALAGRHDGALDPDPVAEVERIEGLVALVAQHRPGDEELDLAGPVPHGGEGQLALAADEEEATGDGHPRLGLGPRGQVAVRGPELAERRAAVEAVGVRVRARRRGGPRAWPGAPPSRRPGRWPPRRRWPGRPPRAGHASQARRPGGSRLRRPAPSPLRRPAAGGALDRRGT